MASTEFNLEREIRGEPQTVEVALSDTNIKAMYATPVLVVPSASNKAIVVDSVEFIMTRTATAYTGGGVVSVQYNSTANGAGTSVQASTIAATVVTGAAGTTYSTRPPATLSDVATASIRGIGLYISNATAAFATGTGTAVVRVTYRTV
jgi:hypothetical protein